jgi:hypothetical protein
MLCRKNRYIETAEHQKSTQSSSGTPTRLRNGTQELVGMTRIPTASTVAVVVETVEAITTVVVEVGASVTMIEVLGTVIEEVDVATIQEQALEIKEDSSPCSTSISKTRRRRYMIPRNRRPIPFFLDGGFRKL